MITGLFTAAVAAAAAHSFLAVPRLCYLEADATPETLVASASAIVRVIALDSARGAPKNDVVRGARVQFRVVEVLRGSDVPAEFSVPGFLTSDDDFNSGSIPYRDVRLSGQGGSCYAFQYRRGAEYLFLLIRARETNIVWTAGEWTPYWASLRPTNEQIRGDTDAWLRWVRHRLALGKPSQH